MNTQKLHNIELPDDYMPNPLQHLQNSRDNQHYLFALTTLSDKQAKTVIDVGSWDGWLPILLTRDGYQVTMVEFIASLVKAALRYKATFMVNDLEIVEGDFLQLNTLTHVDAITCFEVLEHVPFESVPAFLRKMESLASNVLISLPNQEQSFNPQHQWTPTEKLITDLLGREKNFKLEYITYPLSTTVPGNWFLSYDT